MCLSNVYAIFVFLFSTTIDSNLVLATTSHVFSDIPEKDMVISGSPLFVYTGVNNFASCGAKCLGEPGCQSVNYNSATGECQIMTGNLCDGSSSLTSTAGFSYYDVENERLDERLHQLRSHPDCTVGGKCSPKCGMFIGDSCSMDSECRARDVNTACVGSTCSCISGMTYNVTVDACTIGVETTTTVVTTTTLLTTTTTESTTSTVTTSTMETTTV